MSTREDGLVRQWLALPRAERLRYVRHDPAYQRANELADHLMELLHAAVRSGEVGLEISGIAAPTIVERNRAILARYLSPLKAAAWMAEGPMDPDLLEYCILKLIAAGVSIPKP
jgi:hypothetical protein